MAASQHTDIVCVCERESMREGGREAREMDGEIVAGECGGGRATWRKRLDGHTGRMQGGQEG